MTPSPKTPYSDSFWRAYFAEKGRLAGLPPKACAITVKPGFDSYYCAASRCGEIIRPPSTLTESEFRAWIDSLFGAGMGETVIKSTGPNDPAFVSGATRKRLVRDGGA